MSHASAGSDSSVIPNKKPFPDWAKLLDPQYKFIGCGPLSNRVYTVGVCIDFGDKLKMREINIQVVLSIACRFFNSDAVACIAPGTLNLREGC